MGCGIIVTTMTVLDMHGKALWAYEQARDQSRNTELKKFLVFVVSLETQVPSTVQDVCWMGVQQSISPTINMVQYNDGFRTKLIGTIHSN